MKTHGSHSNQFPTGAKKSAKLYQLTYNGGPVLASGPYGLCAGVRKRLMQSGGHTLKLFLITPQ